MLVVTVTNIYFLFSNILYIVDFFQELIMFAIDSLLVRTDVTCVTIADRKVLAGIGGHLHIYDTSTSPMHIVEIFKGNKIYGIVADSTYQEYLIYGGNQLKSFKCSQKNSTNFKEITSYTCADWILEAKWLNSTTNIVTVFMHNIVILWSKEMKLLKKIICEERCLLYSAYLVNDCWDNLIILSGTVFSEVLIWSPKKTENEALCPVLYRLNGHKGVIFSIHYNPRAGIICSTSDDRTAILWSVASKNLLTELMQPTIQISLKLTLYGHSARVFRCRVLDNYILTAGEDSLVNVWNLEGQLIRKLEAHQGACIWSLDCVEQKNIIVTGGGDCGVTLFPLTQHVKKLQLHVKSNEVPKKVAILKNNDVVTVSENGLLEYYCVKQNRWTEITRHEDLESYVLLEVSLCRNLIALAGYHGTVHIYKQFSDSIKELFVHEVTDKSRIFAIHWLSCELYLTCGPEGIISLWNIMTNQSALAKTFQLPISKERWTTAACLCGQKYMAIGDRKGNVYLYSLDIPNPIQIIKKAHNHLGVTNLHYKDNELISLGRNSVLKRYSFNNTLEELSVESSDKLPFTWLAALRTTRSSTLLLTFLGNEFVIWDYKKRRTIIQFPCGGGHRSWDFYENDNVVQFVFIKDKNINLTSFQWNTLHPCDIISSFHVSEINSACCINFTDLHKCLFISGGEDTTLRISNVDFKKSLVNFTNLNVYKSHLSSIRVVASCKTVGINDNENSSETYLIFSAGGRAQIILWELQINFKMHSDINVVCSEKYSYYEQLKNEDSETRIMDLCPILLNNQVLLIAACSDGTLKVFLIAVGDNRNNYEMVLVGSINYKLKCILKLSHLEICGYNIILSMATDGKIAFWDFTDFFNNIILDYKENQSKHLDIKNFHCIQVHQSGINSFAYNKINSNQCILLSGGDDNAIIANLCEFTIHNKELDVNILSTVIDISSHCAQITGVLFSDNYFLTTSVDQKLNIFEWEIQNEKLQCNHIQKHNSPVADIQGMKCFEMDDGTIFVFVYGKGMELCKIKVTSQNKICMNAS